MALTLDGSASLSNWSGTSSKTITLTTSLTNDVIVVVIMLERPTNILTIGSVTASGLTFTFRGGASETTNGSGPASRVEIWTAPATSALSSALITVTTTGSANVDDACIAAFGVNGAHDINAPFDSNAGLPATVDTSTTTSPAVTYSTSQANAFIIAAVGCGQSGTYTIPSGFTSIANVQNNGGGFFGKLCVAYNVVSATQSSVTATFTGPSFKHAVIADAITADVAISGFSIFRGCFVCT